MIWLNNRRESNQANVLISKLSHLKFGHFWMEYFIWWVSWLYCKFILNSFCPLMSIVLFPEWFVAWFIKPLVSSSIPSLWRDGSWWNLYEFQGGVYRANESSSKIDLPVTVVQSRKSNKLLQPTTSIHWPDFKV